MVSEIGRKLPVQVLESDSITAVLLKLFAQSYSSDLTLYTDVGVFTGKIHWLSPNGVLILAEATGVIGIGTQQEKLRLSYISMNSIRSVSMDVFVSANARTHHHQEEIKKMSPMEEKKAKRAVDETLAESVTEIEKKHDNLAVSFDWAAFDVLDWDAMGKSKDDEMPYLKGHFLQFGYGFNCACKDPDYLEELLKVDEIVICPAPMANATASSVLSGSKLIVSFNLAGSTMGGDNWEAAIKSAY